MTNHQRILSRLIRDLEVLYGPITAMPATAPLATAYDAIGKMHAEAIEIERTKLGKLWEEEPR